MSLLEEGKLKPVITETVHFEVAVLQQVFEASLKGTNNVGNVVVKCNQQNDLFGSELAQTV